MCQLRSFVLVLLTCSLMVRVAWRQQPSEPSPTSDRVVQEKRVEGNVLTDALPGDVKTLVQKSRRRLDDGESAQ